MEAVGIYGTIAATVSKVAAILGFSLVTLLVLSDTAVSAQTRKGPTRAVRFDEFGQVGHCDLGARMDNFAISLQNTPGARAAMIVYGPDGDGPRTGRKVLEMLKDYLVNFRGIAANQIETIYGGRNSDLHQSKAELWLVPQGAPLPRPQKHETNIETFQGLFADEPAADDFGILYFDEVGPGIGAASDASFADMLRQQKNAVGYIVVYSGEDLTPGAWRKLGQKEIDNFKSAFDLETSRFKLIFGGQEEKTHIQYWILPNNAPPPVPDAGNEKPLAKTVKAGDFDVYGLEGESTQNGLFTRLSDILLSDKTVRAFLVVSLEESKPPLRVFTEPATSNAEPVVEEHKPVDLTKLVEKWRLELATTHKIGPDRLIIVYDSSPEVIVSQLSLWIVPNGAPLPNPNEDDTDVEP